jgi:TolB-like protein/DNA-binding winged helix-turn-helix (wHTH) protein/tetratricopeptide (TPR) repeat protein
MLCPVPQVRLAVGIRVPDGLSSSVVRFGDFELDRRSRELRKRGVRIALQERPLQVLDVLLRTPGELVTREALQHELWGGDTFVDFETGLNAAVRRLREALRDSADTPRFIETLPRRGYRFIADVHPSEPAEAPRPDLATTPAPPMSASATMQGRHGKWRVAIGPGAIVLLIAVIGVTVWWSRRSTTAEARGPIQSIAVLPFRSLPETPEGDFFAEGITEAVTTDLASISSLRVVSRQSVVRFRNSAQPASEIARALGVDALILGTVARSGTQVRLTAQLVDASTDQHLWADRYQRPLTDVLALQGELARSVADAVRATVSDVERDALAHRRAVDPEAYTTYLRGQHLVGLRGNHVAEGITQLEASIARDPMFAPAYGAAAVAYVLQSGELGTSQLRLAHEAAQQALALDPRQTEALVVRNLTTLLAARDWPAGVREFERIVQQSPSNELARGWFATMLLAQCRADEGLAQRQLALRLNPLSNAANNSMSLVLAMAGRYEESLAAFRRTLDLDPNYADAHGWLGWTYLRMGRRDQGLAELETAVRLAPNDPRMVARLAQGYGLAGRAADARRLVTELEQRARTQRVPPLLFAGAYAGLGEFDRAFASLDAASVENDGLGRMGYEPLLLPLYRDPRFERVLRHMNLPGPCDWGTLRQGS